MEKKTNNIASLLLASFIVATPLYGSGNLFWDAMSHRNLVKYLVAYPFMASYHEPNPIIPLFTYFSTMPPSRNFHFGVRLTIEGSPEKGTALTFALIKDRNSEYRVTFSHNRPAFDPKKGICFRGVSE